jgi:dihydroceramidase
VHSPFVAEWYNTLSSVCIVLVALYGLVSGWRAGWRGRTLLPFALMLAVGLGSCCFHGTLQRWGQALDELPMIYAASTLLVLSLEPDAPARRPWLARALAVYCLATTAAYLLLESFFPFFIGSYIVLVLAQFYYALQLAEEARAAQPGAPGLLVFSSVVYLFGFFALWVPDFFGCAAVQWGSFHAWFHLTSCLGPWALINFFSLVVHERGKRSKRHAPQLHYVACVVPVVVVVAAAEAPEAAASGGAPRAARRGASKSPKAA